MKARAEDLDDLERTNAAFRAEVERFAFKYRCGSCVHVHRQTSSCSLGYPNDFLVGCEIVVQLDGNLTFCKYFEVGETIMPLKG